MSIPRSLQAGAAGLALSAAGGVFAAPANPAAPLVRIAELRIKPSELAHYKEAVREEIEASVRVEPGVLAIYCVAEKDDETLLHFFEMYADKAAYEAHIASPHFRKYADRTKDMIVSKKLIDTEPVQLSAKQAH